MPACRSATSRQSRGRRVKDAAQGSRRFADGSLVRFYLAFIALALVLSGGCSDESARTRHEQRNVKVRTVTHYELTLGPEAAPEQVAFVALRAIKEDFHAADIESREAALDIQFDVCASGYLKPPSRSQMTDEEYLYEIVAAAPHSPSSGWTPTISHYVDDLETDWEKARARLVRRGPTSYTEGVEECEVLIEVDDVHAGRNPSARVVIVVWLVRDNGYWRVTHVGFDSTPGKRGTDVSRRKIISPPSRTGGPRQTGDGG